MSRGVRFTAIAIGCFLPLTVILFACPQGNVAVDPPVTTQSSLDVAHRLTFARFAQLKDAGGNNLISHNVISDPSILFEDGKYRMWFTAAVKPHQDSQQMGVAYAESEDGITWQARLEADREPQLFLKPTPEGWDAAGVETPSVVKGPDGRYWLFYSGDVPPKGSHSWAIGAAVSDDGFNWTKVGDGPVLDGQGDWDGPFHEGEGSKRKRVGGVSEPTVIFDKDAGLFKMWFSALGNRNSKTAFRIGYATSPDGTTWQKHPDPVFEPEEGVWDDAVVSHTNVVADPSGGYHLFYFGTSAVNYQTAEKNGAAMIPGSIGHAYSTDGLTWTRDANPVLSVVPSTWEAWMVGGPTALIRDGEVKLWYFASAEHKKYDFRFGLATARLSGTSPQL